MGDGGRGVGSDQVGGIEGALSPDALTNAEINDLANRFPDWTSARRLLDEVGLPPGRQPSWQVSDARGFFSEVSRLVAHGALQDGKARLLEAARSTDYQGPLDPGLQAARKAGGDYFVSFAGENLEQARWVARTLERAAFRVFFQESTFVPGTDWQVAMRAAAATECRYTVALLSPHFLASQYAMEEWLIADRRGTVVPVLLEALQKPGRRRAPGTPPRAVLRRMHAQVWVDLTGWDLLGADEPAARMKLLNGLDAARQGEDRPPVRNDAPEPPRFFTERSGLADLSPKPATATTLGSPVDARRRPAVTVLHGPPGVGKTSLAAELARKAANERFVFWINGMDLVVARAEIGGLASFLGTDAGNDPARGWRTPADRVLAALAGRHGWLLVIDGTDQISPVDLATLIPKGGEGQVVITSRSAVALDGVNSIEVTPFGREEAIAYLRGETQGAGLLGDDAELAEVADALGGLPVALDQARRHWSRDAAAYLRELDSTGARLLDGNESPHYGRSVAATIRLALTDLGAAERPVGQARVPLGAAAADLLGVLCALGGGPIPLDLVRAAAADLEPPLAQIAAYTLDLGETVAALLGCGLALRHAGGPATREAVSVPPVIRLVVLAAAAESGRRDELADAAVRMLYTVAAAGVEDRPAAWRWWNMLLSHLRTVAATSAARRMVLPGDDLPAAVALLDASAAYLRLCGDTQAAIEDSQAALDLAERHARGRSGETRRGLVERGAAVRTIAEALADRPDVAGADIALSLTQRRHRLACALLAGGQPGRALELSDGAAATLRAELGCHPLLAEVLMTRAGALRDLDLPGEALAELDDAIAIVESLYGDRAEDLPRYLTNRAVLRHDLLSLPAAPAAGAAESERAASERHAAAEEGLRDLERAAAIVAARPAPVVPAARAIPAVRDFEDARRLSVAAALMSAQGRHSQAVERFAAAADILVGDLDVEPDHPFLLAARHNLRLAGSLVPSTRESPPAETGPGQQVEATTPGQTPRDPDAADSSRSAGAPATPNGERTALFTLRFASAGPRLSLERAPGRAGAWPEAVARFLAARVQAVAAPVGPGGTQKVRPASIEHPADKPDAAGTAGETWRLPPEGPRPTLAMLAADIRTALRLLPEDADPVAAVAGLDRGDGALGEALGHPLARVARQRLLEVLERVECHLGALLVTRYRAWKCDEGLASVLDAWDGRLPTLTADLVAAIATHVDGCTTCADSRALLIGVVGDRGALRLLDLLPPTVPAPPVPIVMPAPPATSPPADEPQGDQEGSDQEGADNEGRLQVRAPVRRGPGRSGRRRQSLTGLLPSAALILPILLVLGPWLMPRDAGSADVVIAPHDPSPSSPVSPSPGRSPGPVATSASGGTAASHALLRLSSPTLDFGLSQTRMSTTLRNDGGRSAKPKAPKVPAWLQISRLGTLAPHAKQVVTVTVDRAAAPKQFYTVVTFEPEKDGQSAKLVVFGGGAPPPPAFELSTASVDLGPLSTTAPVTLRNTGGRASTVTVDGPGGDINITAPAGPVPAGGTVRLNARADRRNFPPGRYHADFDIAPTDGGTGAHLVVWLTVAPPEPTMSVRPPSGNAPLTVTADASASRRGSAEITHYTFVWGDGAVEPTDSTNATHQYQAPGTYPAQVQVTDAFGHTATSERHSVQVNATPPTAMLSLVGHKGPPPVSITADASGSRPGSAAIDTYTFYWDDGSSTSTTSPTAPHTYQTPGLHDVTVAVRDKLGNTTTSKSAGIRVLLPAPSLVSPPDGTHYDGSHQVTFSWTPVSGAVKYLVERQCCGNTSWASPPTDTLVRGTSISIEVTGDASSSVERWGVLAIDTDGFDGAASEWWTYSAYEPG